ncbi:MAG: phage terminase large subunit [Bacteroides sp.]|nr:phage terminase large subunit [Bacteroides sp.]
MATATRADKIALIQAMQEQLNRKSRTDLLRFTLNTMPTFRPADFHKRYYSVLTDFAHGKIKKLMVFMPPQHGKSEGSTRRLPSFLLGQNPDLRLAILSYSATKAKKFNREIQRIIDTPEYHAIFPETTLGQSQFMDDSGRGYIRTTEECEIVNHIGGFKTVGVGGALTGEPVDVLIMDDIYKDAKSAWSPTIRENIADWYDTVAETRLHNDSQQLIVFTRWHEDDLAGTLLRQQGVFDKDKNPNGWVVVVYQAIKEGAPTDYDPRQDGEPLWPERHNLDKLQAIRKRNPQVFGSLYQQNPQPSEGLMYESGFSEYITRPATMRCRRKAYVDTADTGDDYLCAIIYDETEVANYIVDVFYTSRSMEYTEPELAKMLCKHRVDECVVESNNGGRGFARNVEKQCRIMGNNKTVFKWFTQTDNKDVRIFSNSATVQNLTIMPQGWKRLFPEFANAICGYLKAGKNAHDDAPDALTGTIERRQQRRTSNVAELFGY